MTYAENIDFAPCSVCTRRTLIDGNVTPCGDVVCDLCEHECGECERAWAS